MKHARIQKVLSRTCPECGGKLRIVLRSETINGVEYSKSFIECLNCNYKKLYRDLINKSSPDY